VNVAMTLDRSHINHSITRVLWSVLLDMWKKRFHPASIPVFAAQVGISENWKKFCTNSAQVCTPIRKRTCKVSLPKMLE
jgi:hypothetical protein